MKNLIELLNVYDVASPKVRIGHDRDGGYVINQTILEANDRLISIGMGSEDTFERDWVKRVGTAIEAYDGTYPCQTLCAENPELMNEKIFYVHHNVGMGEREVPLGAILGKKNVLLKMDVEGAEYSIFGDMVLDENVVGLLLEIHDIHVPENQEKLNKLIEHNFQNLVLFHLHGNSWGGTFEYRLGKLPNRGLSVEGFPHVMELSFINKRLLSNWTLDEQIYPIAGLDFTNKPDESDLDLYWINSL